MPDRPDPTGALALRTAALQALFTDIGRTRMAGVPVMNPALRVEAVGFAVLAPHQEERDGRAQAIGVLIAPWFMNLVCLPLRRLDDSSSVGAKRPRALGDEVFEFIGAHEPAFGAFAACSLFSPMFEFADQDIARATAQEVLAVLRRAAAQAPAAGRAGAPPPRATARRAFLFGRGAAPVPGP